MPREGLMFDLMLLLECWRAPGLHCRLFTAITGFLGLPTLIERLITNISRSHGPALGQYITGCGQQIQRVPYFPTFWLTGPCGEAARHGFHRFPNHWHFRFVSAMRWSGLLSACPLTIPYLCNFTCTTIRSMPTRRGRPAADLPPVRPGEVSPLQSRNDPFFDPWSIQMLTYFLCFLRGANPSIPV